MTRGRRPIPETPEGYLARAKAVFKIDPARPELHVGCSGPCHFFGAVTLGELLHAADVMGA